MKVVVKNPGYPAAICNIANTLEALQVRVGGYIETVGQANGLVVICNEEGRLLGMKPNVGPFVGPIVVCGRRGDAFGGLEDGVALRVCSALDAMQPAPDQRCVLPWKFTLREEAM